MNGILYLVATPIGNWEDITFRALRILKEADVIVYEEDRQGKRLLSHYGIAGKIIETLNEHNENENSSIIIEHLKSGKNVALISDAGTPAFSDPGQILLCRAIEQNINIIPVPGVSSLVTALVLSGFPINEFLFYGFLSQKAEIRRKELQYLKIENRTIAFMEAPYRLVPILKDFADVFETERQVFIGFNLTMPDERKFRGTAQELYQYFERNSIKGEFVILIEGKPEFNKFKTIEHGNTPSAIPDT